MYSILIIEDDASFITIMETILQLEGFEVRSASDGGSGLAKIRAQRPDLILCDIMMADMDGHSVLEMVKSENSFVDIPFIFVTALSDRADVRRGMSAGADDYLTKPFTADELLAAVTGRILHHEKIYRQHQHAVFQHERATLQKKITQRELEVLLLVGEGVTTRGIAERLGVSLKTIEAHRANLMKSLGVANAASLARWAIIAGQK